MSEPSTTSDIPPVQEFLTAEFVDMIHYVERYHAIHGEAPGDEQMLKRFNIAQPLLEEFKVDMLVHRSLTERGIVYPPRKDFLNDRQIAAVAAMTNYVDKRSDEKKLRDIGISTREWATWLLDNNFSEYLQERAERMFRNSQHEAHMGLIKGMRNGNVASVKLFNEMSGRHNPEAENNFNIRILLSGIIEILQLEIRDPIILNRIATKMMNLAAREQQNNALGMGASGRYAPVVIEQKELPIGEEL